MQLIRPPLPSSLLCCSSLSPSTFRRKAEKLVVRCSIERPASDNAVPRYIYSGLLASCVFLSQAGLVHATDLSLQNNICQLANVSSNQVPFPLDERSGDPNGKSVMMMMRGMTAKDFDPARYAGRWFEVASLKRGFAGQGQEDCHCTQSFGVENTEVRLCTSDSSLPRHKWELSRQWGNVVEGVYTLNMEEPSILVDTFCVHGSPDGYITGIRGKVQCLSEEDKEQKETDLERQEMIKEKCYLRFPTLPFIPKEPYDVIATDYDNFSLVSGSKDRSFIQIYSRTPNPGPEFIAKYKSYLGDLGYDPNKIKDTPQDCQVMSNTQLAAMMTQKGMQQALTNQFPDLELRRSVEFNPFTSVLDTLKKLVELYFKQFKTPI